jgi:hypothetical protein
MTYPKKLLCLVVIFIALTACSSEPDERLIEFAKDNNFEVPVYFMERRGDYFQDKWHKTTLYFGFGADWNFKTCQEDAERLNKELKSITFRCVSGN